MKSNIHHTTSEDVERMKDYQRNRLQRLQEMADERPKDRTNRLKQFMSFPEFLNSVSPYLDELVSSNASEEK